MLNLAEALGRRPIVLNFWAGWRVPCRIEAPVLRDAERRYRAHGIPTTVSINVGGRGVRVWTGPLEPERLAAILHALIGTPKG